jgi:hypothetical protein
MSCRAAAISRSLSPRATARATAHWAPVSPGSPGTSGAEATLTA